MKKLFIALVIVVTAPAVNAAQATNSQDDFCQKLMPCGTYEGTGANYGKDGKKIADSDYKEVVTITATDALTAVVTDKMSPVDQPDELFYDLEVTFEFDGEGAYKVHNQGPRPFLALGACKDLVCTFNFVPFANDLGKTTANVMFMRFENGKLLRQMMSSVEYGNWAMQRSELTKQ